MNITSGMEKLFFAYILENPKFFDIIPAEYYKNPQIKFCYNVVRKHVLGLPNRLIPNPKQIVELIRLEDPTKAKVPDAVLKQLLTVDLGEYITSEDDKWLDKTFKAWNIHKGISARLMVGIEQMRKIELDNQTLDFDEMLEVAEKMRELIGDANLVNYDDDDMGLDFFDPLAHEQDVAGNKIKTGWTKMDELLGGGWDRKTLNVFIGGSNSGKSMWMGNVLANAMLDGKNVVYFSFEMSEKKVMKRLGSNLLSIPINNYDEAARDKNMIKERLASLNRQIQHGFNTEERRVGKLRVKEFPAGTATIYDLDNYLKQLKTKQNLDIDLIVVDYLTLMNAADKNGSLYTNGKKLAEGVRAIAQKYNLVAITATQISKDAFEAQDITAKDISESKAIYETADNMFGIIRTEAMKKQNMYYLKLLKIRDGEFSWIRCKFEMDARYLKIINDAVIE